MFSASDVANFLACHHLSTLERARAAGEIERPYFEDATVELLRELGSRHEDRYFRHLVEVEKREIVSIPTNLSSAEGARLTTEALRGGASVIYQATFHSGVWHGRADFLMRVSKPSLLGGWSYEPLETKLALTTKAGALVQLCFYAELLSQIQGAQPDCVLMVLGHGTEMEKIPVGQYLAYFRRVKREFETAHGKAADSYPEPVEHCDVCSWFTVCDKRRHADDHLSLVPGATQNQRKILSANHMSTVAKLAAMKLEPPTRKIEGIGNTALARIHNQARVQMEGRRQGRAVYELLEAGEVNTGLGALPAPSPGDIFLDLEGDSFAFDTGLEYLIGFFTVPESNEEEPVYRALWSFDRKEEKSAFVTFIGHAMKQWRKHPGMHIYHYAPYEPTQIKRLAGQHGVCIEELDELLRARVFVDLYRVVRQGLRASVESYSIKKIEALYKFERVAPARESVLALQAFAGALALGDPRDVPGKILRAIESYNRDDCVSAWRLRAWLEERRLELEARDGKALGRPTIQEEKKEELSPRVQQVRALTERLTSGLPGDETQWNSEQRAVWLLAQMLEYHRREDKSAWWEYFRLCDLTDEELVEDKNALGGLKYAGAMAQVKKSLVHRYSFPAQDHSIDRALQIHDPKTKARAGTFVAIDEQAGTIDIKRGMASNVTHPAAVIPQNVLKAEAQEDSLMRMAAWVADHGISGRGSFQAARDLLLRNPPRVTLGNLDKILDESGRVTEPAATELAALCAHPSVLAMQGPPGSGKSFTGAKMIVELVRQGKKVGITAASHKVISNILQYVCTQARADQMVLRTVQKANDDDGCRDTLVDQASGNEAIYTALRSNGVQVVAGSPWLWARADVTDSVDVLFVDEAGQMALADVLAISQAARSMVLLGDPQQLNQPMQGVHPPGVEVSALAHLLDGRATMGMDKGLFLKETYRLHPDICAFTSEIFYDGRLAPRLENAKQRLNAKAPLDGTGLRYFPVEHSGNQIESREEAEKISELIRGLFASGATWTDKSGQKSPLGLQDVLVVAPYNAQVSALAKALPEGTRVGTVDKFQGQQAPVVIYSMTTSTAEDAPRGMEFLYSLNRLNVAVSRAQCVAVIVASPELFQVACKTPRQMQLANALCRYLEMAKQA